MFAKAYPASGAAEAVADGQESRNRIKARLVPADAKRIEQIVSRMCMHFRIPDGRDTQSVIRDYVAALGQYPEDLLCAAYHHCLMHHDKHCLPPVSSLTLFMEPEMRRRHQVLDNLA